MQRVGSRLPEEEAWTSGFVVSRDGARCCAGAAPRSGAGGLVLKPGATLR